MAEQKIQGAIITAPIVPKKQNSELPNIEVGEVTYKTYNGNEVTLNRQAIMNITNNNQYITNSEVVLFIETCKFLQINPFLREAHLIKYDNSKPAQTIIAQETFRKRAERESDFMGIEEGIVVQTKDGELVEREGAIYLDTDKLRGGYARVWRKNCKTPYVAKCLLSEYSTGKSTWVQMPATMIKKVAVVQALRAAYPNIYGSYHAQEEMSQELEQDAKTYSQADKPVYDISFDETENNAVEPIVEPLNDVVDDVEKVEAIESDIIEISCEEYKANKDIYFWLRDTWSEGDTTVKVRRKV